MKPNTTLNYILYLLLGNYIEPLLQDNTRVAIKYPINPIEISDGDYKVLPYETPSNLEEISNELLLRQINSDLNNKSKDEIEEIQSKIASAGHYDLFLYGLSKEQIKDILRKLQAKNLYTGKIDGMIGPETINAYRQYNIDRLVGNRTREGYSKLLAPNVNYSYGAACTPDKGCAEFVTHSYNKTTNQADSNGVVGDAWRMPMNIIKAGGKEIYNIYSDPRFKQNRNNVQEIRNLHQLILSQNKIDLSLLKPGDVVGMYNPGSMFLETANKEGTTFNSHVGLVVALDTDGTPIIEHNMHGNVRRERADKLGRRLISVAVRPNFKGKIPAINWELQESDYHVDEKIDNDNLKIYRDSMAGISPTIAKIFPNVPLDKIQELALGILGRETNFMNDLESNRSGMAGFKRDAELWVRTNIFKEGNLSKSSDLTKTKFTSFTPEERQFLGINSPEDLNDPKKAGAAVLYLLSKNYNYMNNYLQTYPELGLTDEDKFNATAMSYNQGMGENSSSRSWGFDSETGIRNDEEINTLRQHSDTNQVVYSYPATKYAKIDKLLKFTGLEPGKFVYNLIGKDREGYAATALKNINRYISHRKQGGNMNYIDYYKNGSGIYIKPSHKGRFTEYCDGKVTQDCINRGKRSPNPKIRKQAVFAENARKWKHQGGGEMLYLQDWFDNILEKQNVFFNAKENKFEEIVPEVKEAERKSFTPLVNLDAAEPEELYDNSWMTELLLILSRSSQEGSASRQATTSSTGESTTRQLTPSSTGRSSIGRFTNAWQEFRDTLYNIFRNRGYSEDTSKVMVALMGQESGHGQYLTGDYNYSNITRGSNWTGRTTKVGTNPNIFRSYDNLEQAIDDYLALNKAYGINENTSKDEVLQRWLGHNDKKLAWNGKDNTAYKNKINAVYKMYWG